MVKVNQAAGARSDAAAQLKDLVRQRALAQHQLGVLTGHLDLAVTPTDLAHLPQPAQHVRNERQGTFTGRQAVSYHTLREPGLPREASEHGRPA